MKPNNPSLFRTLTSHRFAFLPLHLLFSSPSPLLVWVCPSRCLHHLLPQISKARSPRYPPAPAAMSASSTPVDASGEPIPTSSVLMAASKHIAVRCRPENVAFLNCKKKDPNPDKCLEKGRQVTRCVLSLLKELHQKCPKEMDAYAGCMYYYTNEFDFCRKEQQAFEEACPISE